MVPCGVWALALRTVGFVAFTILGFVVFSALTTCPFPCAGARCVTIALAVEALFDAALRCVPLGRMALFADVYAVGDALVCHCWVFREYDDILCFSIGVASLFAKGGNSFDLDSGVVIFNQLAHFFGFL